MFFGSCFLSLICPIVFGFVSIRTTFYYNKEMMTKFTPLFATKRLKALSPLYKPSSANQQLYAEYLHDHHKTMVVALGPAGSGKTLFACIEAITLLQRGSIKKIVITRPLVPVEEEEIGFLPGNLVNKMDPWTRPVIDIFSEFYSMNDISNMLRNGIMEIAPLAFMRGRTFHETFVIADEMQNSSPSQMLMLATRIGRHSKLVVTGDLAQSDRDLCNGLQDLTDKYYMYKKRVDEFSLQNLKNMDEIAFVQMNTTDIKRSRLVSHVLELYSNYNVI